jgi:nucleotide-binding universal stress UspA family protein
MKQSVSSKGTVLLATDFSASAARVTPYAMALASSLNLSLTVVHVVKAPPGSEDWSPAARRSIDSLKTRALLELARVARLADDKGIAVDHTVPVGIPADSILKVAEDADVKLIVVGTHGRTGWNRLRLGSVAETIVREASCPVLTGSASDRTLSRAGAVWPKSPRLLVAVDFSLSSRAAFRLAVVLARRLRAQMTLLHAAEPSGRSRSHGHIDASYRRKAERWFQAAVSAGRAGHMVNERIVIPGNPADVILDQAKRARADLIVMGSHGRRGLRLLMLGSVARSVIRKARSPVLVVKARRKP